MNNKKSNKAIKSTLAELLETKNKKVFEQSKDVQMITVRCPDCENDFGLKTTIVESLVELNYKYTCPYCGRQHFLNNN